MVGWSGHASHKEGFVTVNGVRLQYLDWGGTGPALIFIHGVLCNPHAFDDLAPAFTDRFRVIAYARRGHGGSEAKAPYDTDTLTEDLRGLMDALGISNAHLVGWSMGGNEVTAMAGKYPNRVGRIVYLDGAFDWADPDWKIATDDMPPYIREKPAGAMLSLDAYCAYVMSTSYTQLDDLNRIEACLREDVVVQTDGSVKPRMPSDVVDAFIHTLFNDRRDYARVRAPALALNSETMFDLKTPDARRNDELLLWERKYRDPFRAKSVARVREELANVQILDIPGSHGNFFITAREQVVAAMRNFLAGSTP